MNLVSDSIRLKSTTYIIDIIVTNTPKPFKMSINTGLNDMRVIVWTTKRNQMEKNPYKYRNYKAFDSDYSFSSY